MSELKQPEADVERVKKILVDYAMDAHNLDKAAQEIVRSLTPASPTVADCATCKALAQVSVDLSVIPIVEGSQTCPDCGGFSPDAMMLTEAERESIPKESDFMLEVESMASIGLSPEDSLDSNEYNRRLPEAREFVSRRRTAEKQLQKVLSLQKLSLDGKK